MFKIQDRLGLRSWGVGSSVGIIAHDVGRVVDVFPKPSMIEALMGQIESEGASIVTELCTI